MVTMRKLLLLVLLVLGLSSVGAEPLDFIVLLDISESTFPYFDEMANYLIRDIVGKHLAPGDGFHLLSFADLPEIELVLDVESGNGVGRVLDRISLLQPLGQYTDLVEAFNFLYSYTSSLRPSSHKKILVLTDGIHDPPQGSAFPVSGGNSQKAATDVVAAMLAEGWEIRLVQFPTAEATAAHSTSPGADVPGADPDIFMEGRIVDSESGETTVVAGDAGGTEGRLPWSVDDSDSTVEGYRDSVVDGGPASDTGKYVADTMRANRIPDADSPVETDLFSVLSDDLGVDVVPYDGQEENGSHEMLGAPELVFPEDLGNVGYRFTLPLTVRNPSSERVLVELTEILWNGIDILERDQRATVAGTGSRVLRARVALPATLPAGKRVLLLTAGFSDELRIFPRSGITAIELREEPSVAGSLLMIGMLKYVAAGIGGLIALALLALAVRRLIHNGFGGAKGTQLVRRSKDSYGDRAIEMYVEGQNSNIGMRNVHAMKEGGAKSIGGGPSAFLIYMYRFPKRIAFLSRKGDTYTFTPSDAERCESKSAVDDCLEKDLYLISTNNRRVRVRFRRHVSALEEINRIMHLADTPGRRLRPSK